MLRVQPRLSISFNVNSFPKGTWRTSHDSSLGLTLPSCTCLTGAHTPTPDSHRCCLDTAGSHRCCLDTADLIYQLYHGPPPFLPWFQWSVVSDDLKRGKLNKALGSRGSGQATSALDYLRQNGTGGLVTKAFGPRQINSAERAPPPAKSRQSL